MATKQGKVTTAKSRFIELAKGVRAGAKNALLAWCDVVDEYDRHDGVSVRSFAQAYEQALKGSQYDEYSASVIQVQMGLVIWANKNIKGGARACKSLNHIVSQKKESKGSPAPKAFDAERESMRYSVAQLEAMLAFRRKAQGKNHR